MLHFRSILSPVFLGLISLSFSLQTATHVAAEQAAATTEKIFNSRPKPDQRKEFGHVGPTGIEVLINPGVEVMVETTTKNSPAAGKFNQGDIILGVNGQSLQGQNPFVALGQAITNAEASDGKLVFEIQRGDKRMQVPLTIPVMGAYSPTWPVDCDKSKKIIDQAAAFYSKQLQSPNVDRGVPGALMALFLLSTGDDAYLPIIKQYFQPMIDNPQGIGEHSWNNGYNGIACAEYYLRTGDKDVLPVLQYYADDAKHRQKFDSGWTHWSNGINPRYVAGGLMNAAGVQMLTTLLLAKECGVDVDDQTLNNALRFFYRFVGHGTVPYGDHRSEGGLGSNGKDGMLAAAMQVASGATSDTSIYESARDYLSMSTLKSYPTLATGHGDNGRGDGIWRGMSSVYLMDEKPEDYRAMMDQLQWWIDLSRFHHGAMGMATVNGFNDTGSGAAVAITLTAPMKHLRILGAPRSEHAVDFELPEQLWGNDADLVFHGIDFLPGYKSFGDEVEPHKLLNMLGSGYSKGQDDLTREQMLQNIFHHRYMFRTQAAKALVKAGELETIEELLRHSDPRVRRAATDGITDWRYWFAMGRNPLKTEQYTPGMIEALGSIITDPNESLYVVEGALFAMHHMPADAIEQYRDQIMKWTQHDDWWIRQAAFMALQGLAKDDQKYVQVAPVLVEMLINEYHTMPRQGMLRELDQTLRRKGADHAASQIILAGFKRAAIESEIKPGALAREGSYNAVHSAKRAIGFDPNTAPIVADALSKRFGELDTERILEVISYNGNSREGLYPVLAELSGEEKQQLTNLLYNAYLPELQERLKADSGTNLALIDTVLALKQLKEDVSGWQALGEPAPENRTWRFMSFDTEVQDEQLPRRERKRFREVTMPQGTDGWTQSDFDDRSWSTGLAPIGKGEFVQQGKKFENRSTWGEGEFLLGRTTFEVDDLDYDLYRLSILNNQGFEIYLNGQKISGYVWWNNTPRYWKRPMPPHDVRVLKKGENTLAVFANVEYPAAMKPNRWKQQELGQIDVWIEGLRKSDLY